MCQIVSHNLFLHSSHILILQKVSVAQALSPCSVFYSNQWRIWTGGNTSGVV